MPPLGRPHGGLLQSHFHVSAPSMLRLTPILSLFHFLAFQHFHASLHLHASLPFASFHVHAMQSPQCFTPTLNLTSMLPFTSMLFLGLNALSHFNASLHLNAFPRFQCCISLQCFPSLRRRAHIECDPVFFNCVPPSHFNASLHFNASPRFQCFISLQRPLLRGHRFEVLLHTRLRPLLFRELASTGRLQAS